MSIKIMAQVWELDLPSSEKFILLGFADHANDKGIGRPTFARVAWKCGISKETIKRAVRGFQASGLMVKLSEAGGPGVASLWRIHPEMGVTLTPFVSDLERGKDSGNPVEKPVEKKGNGGHGAPRKGVTGVSNGGHSYDLVTEDLNRIPQPNSAAAPREPVEIPAPGDELHQLRLRLGLIPNP